MAGRQEGAPRAAEEGADGPRFAAGLASSGRPWDGAMHRRAAQGMTVAVPARQQDATAPAAPQETGRERGGRADGPARAHGLVEPTWWSDVAPGRPGAGAAKPGCPARWEGATTRAASRVGGGAA